ncbi:MAG: flagellin, partial [Betaproteobacteria bacterium]
SHDGSSTAARSGTAAVVTETAARANSTTYYIKNQTTGQEWSFATGTTHNASTYQGLIDAAIGTGKITVAGTTGTMTFTGADDFGNFTINTASGASTNTGANATTVGVIDANDLNLAAATGNDTATIQGSISLSSSKVFSVTQNGTEASPNDNYFTTGAASLSTVSNVDLRTQDKASLAISVLDGAIEKISSMRSDLGAIENRLSHTVSNLMNVAENTSDSKSRIEDADYSKESANLARAQVLQQAGTAMLAQANARSQLVLQLLQ